MLDRVRVAVPRRTDRTLMRRPTTAVGGCYFGASTKKQRQKAVAFNVGNTRMAHVDCRGIRLTRISLVRTMLLLTVHMIHWDGVLDTSARNVEGHRHAVSPFRFRTCTLAHTWMDNSEMIELFMRPS